MKAQKVNPNNMNPMQMNAMSSMMGMMNSIQKIGKGKRNDDVISSIKSNTCVYFAAVGGAGAVLSKCITQSEVIAYPDLGTEAIRKLEVINFPAIVVIDCIGNKLYETAIIDYCITNE